MCYREGKEKGKRNITTFSAQAGNSGPKGIMGRSLRSSKIAAQYGSHWTRSGVGPELGRNLRLEKNHSNREKKEAATHGHDVRLRWRQCCYGERTATARARDGRGRGRGAGSPWSRGCSRWGLRWPEAAGFRRRGGGSGRRGRRRRR